MAFQFRPVFLSGFWSPLLFINLTKYSSMPINVVFWGEMGINSLKFVDN